MSKEDGKVRGTDPSTSVEAARSIDASRLANLVHAALKADGGWLTSFQLVTASGVKYASVTPRMRPLWLAGRVRREKRPALLGKIVSLFHYKAI